MKDVVDTSICYQTHHYQEIGWLDASTSYRDIVIAMIESIEYKKHIKLFKWIESVYAFLYSYYSNQIHIS